MEVGNCIKSRRTIRKYSSIPVPVDKIMAVIEAGNYAPSAGNLQNWKFVLVTNKKLKKEIAEASLKQYWMEKATAHIIIINEPYKITKFYPNRGKLYSKQNCACAAMNMLLMANSIGLGAAWVGAFSEERVKELIGIPDNNDNAIPEIIITIGYPDEEPEVPTKINLKNITFLQRWAVKETPPGMPGDITRNLTEDTTDLVEEITNKAKEKLLKKSKK